VTSSNIFSNSECFEVQSFASKRTPVLAEKS